jgi:hypothetical protein
LVEEVPSQKLTHFEYGIAFGTAMCGAVLAHEASRELYFYGNLSFSPWGTVESSRAMTS